MNYKPLLIPEPPLQVLPSLAALIGLNEALVLQQLHYWLLKSTNTQEGRQWVYNSYAEWCAQFPFWKTYTIQRIFAGLESQGIVIAKRFNKQNYDQRKWYTIDYEALDRMIENHNSSLGDAAKAASL